MFEWNDNYYCDEAGKILGFIRETDDGFYAVMVSPDGIPLIPNFFFTKTATTLAVESIIEDKYEL